MPFTLDKTVKGSLALEQRAAKVPKVADLLSAASVGASHEGAKGLAPPPDIVAKVGCCSPVFAFDIETNTLQYFLLGAGGLRIPCADGSIGFARYAYCPTRLGVGP